MQVLGDGGVGVTGGGEQHDLGPNNIAAGGGLGASGLLKVRAFVSVKDDRECGRSGHVWLLRTAQDGAYFAIASWILPS